jgi:inward rectifier potassium channel
MTSTWPVFFFAAGVIFLGLNFFFALFYLIGDSPIANLYPNGFWGAFFFSVETLSTVGYGDMHPQTTYGHFVSTFEIFVGMSDIAMVTGVIFARFSLPKSKILFTKHPVTQHHDGKYVLCIRIANARFNVISEASAKLRLIRLESTQEDPRFLRIIDLPLIRDTHPMFVLGWSLFHIIDENSPLYLQTAEDLARSQARLILSLEGVDDTTSQPIRARHVYSHSTIRFNHRYQDINHTGEDMVSHVEYSLFDSIKKEDKPEEKSSTG